ncbi:MAG TPA: hypothetical protein VII32_06740, partial [Thermoanaerobaculia bacterium]
CIAEYALVWDVNSHTGRVNLWFERPPTNASQPDQSLSSIAAPDFAAIAALCRSDPDHSVFFDADSGAVASGIDMP